MKSIRSVSTLAVTLILTFPLSSWGQPRPDTQASPGEDLKAVWHLGRVTGDLENILQFYVDLLGLGLRGERDAPIPFYTVDTINEFVGGPQGAEFRAAFMPIPGASSATDPEAQIYLEAFEYRHIDRTLRIPALSDIGVSTLRFLVRDLDAVMARVIADDVAIITQDDNPVTLPVPAGFTGSARSIMVRDPDGYPVELLEITPSPPGLAGPEDAVTGAQMTLVVESIEESLDVFRQLVGGNDLHAWNKTEWRDTGTLEQLRDIERGQYRSQTLLLPGSTIRLELLEFKDFDQARYQPVFQDIGFGHIAFTTGDIEAVYATMNRLGLNSLSDSGTWTQISPTVRAIYTRDHNGFFIEIIENR